MCYCGTLYFSAALAVALLQFVCSFGTLIWLFLFGNVSLSWQDQTLLFVFATISLFLSLIFAAGLNGKRGSYLATILVWLAYCVICGLVTFPLTVLVMYHRGISELSIVLIGGASLLIHGYFLFAVFNYFERLKQKDSDASESDNSLQRQKEFQNAKPARIELSTIV